MNEGEIEGEVMYELLGDGERVPRVRAGHGGVIVNARELEEIVVEFVTIG